MRILHQSSNKNKIQGEFKGILGKASAKYAVKSSWEDFVKLVEQDATTKDLGLKIKNSELGVPILFQ
jgi:hypothetical protein